MKRYLTLILALITLGPTLRGQQAADPGGQTGGQQATQQEGRQAARQGSRQTIDISRDWRFFTQEATGVDNLPYINLPHTWSRDALAGRADYYRGIGTYIKQLNVPAEWKGRRLFLEMDGTGLSADLFVNGRFAGHHAGGYVPFTMEITGLVQQGPRNYIWVAVNNSVQLDVLPTALDADYYGFLRGVKLLITNQVAITGGAASPGVRVVTKTVSRERADGVVQVELTSSADKSATGDKGASGDKSVTAWLAIMSDKGDTVATGHVRVKVTADRRPATANIPFAIDKPTLWNGRLNPYLYNVSVKVADDGVIYDSLALLTGFRTIGYDVASGMLTLNGRPYPVRGVKVRGDRAGAGPALTRAQITEDIRTILEMGANTVRVVGVPHDPAFYDMCDQAGILVWSDLPLQGSNFFTDRQFVPSASFMESGRRQAREIIDRQWNHPSVAMWGIFSDLNLRGDPPINYVRELNKMVKEYDPSRMTVASSNQDGELNFITDLIVWDHTLGWKDGQPSDISLWLTQLGTNWSSLRSAVSFGAGASVLQQEEAPSRPAWNSNWHPEQWQTFFHTEYFQRLKGAPLWGIFVDLFDWGWAAYGYGQEPGVCDMGLISFDHRERKDAFYFYKANWNPAEPFLWLADKRLTVRANKAQTVRAFTDLETAELLLNGVSQGAVDVADGVATWNVQLPAGASTLEVRAGGLSDTMQITFNP